MNRRKFIKNAAGIFVPMAFHILVPSARSQKSPAFLNQSLKYRTAAAAGGASYILEQNCEDTGTPTDWTDTSSPDWDYTGVVLEGSQSLRFNVSASTANTVSPNFSDMTEAWGYFLWRPVSLGTGGNRIVFNVRNSSGASTCLRIRVDNSTIDIVCGSASGSTVDGLSDGNTYHFWWHYIKGTGADAFASVAFSTDGVKPTSGNAYRELTTGTSIVNAANIQVGPQTSTTADWVFDKFRVDDEDIGDNPS